jgi:hypothetical protein
MTSRIVEGARKRANAGGKNGRIDCAVNLSASRALYL